jgi:hypothetical protein
MSWPLNPAETDHEREMDLVVEESRDKFGEEGGTSSIVLTVIKGEAGDDPLELKALS